MNALTDFHFIRPLVLLALIPLILLWLLLRRRTDATQPWRNIIAPHLLPYLLHTTPSSGENPKSKIKNLVTPLTLIALGWIVSTIAIAGPTWHRERSPFSTDTAALAIVIHVSDSMKTEDVQPSRLARATEKIHDLLALRAGSKTILIAYAGTAHTVMPATNDAGIINTFAQALEPRIMPVRDGDAAAQALTLATRALADAGGGSILWITDSISPEEAAPLAAWRKTTTTDITLYPPLLPGTELDALMTASRSTNADIVKLTADDADTHTLAHAAKFASTNAGDDTNTRWAETGYWLTPLLALLLLPFFRRGWMVSTAARS